MEEPEMQLKVKKVTDKFTESMYVLANEPSVALYRLQEHVRRSLPELAQHKHCCPTRQESSSQFLISDNTGHPLPCPQPSSMYSNRLEEGETCSICETAQMPLPASPFQISRCST
ncbi:BLOC-1-related complex subunit 8 isoform X2 [Rhea pennata]|uniref:BLOC-1-related complex subunit 8 isoform X2 n=1 Tax=Rhea pennata TaxID=8795 RepID=UPI002E2767DC